MRNRNLKKIIWIFCEGKKTEINYFKGLIQDYRNFKFHIEYLTNNFTSNNIEKKLIKRKSELGISEEDKLFLVFDVDKKSKKCIEEIKKICEKKNFIPIISNPCIEVWFLSHFQKITYLYDIQGVQNKLKEKYQNYKKTDVEIYEKLKPKLEIAIKNENEFSNIYEIYEYIKKD